MPNQARRKEKQRLKREKKKAQLRREMSVSPYKRIGEAGPIEACYINSDWRQNGLASIHVIRRNPSGGHALACFLIDVWCAGLKDAWGRIDLMQEDVDRNLKLARENFDLERIEIEAVRQLVAGSIRFARQNGFRLPDHYDRWINLLGGVGSIDAAPLEDFGKEGKLMWVGPMEDLRRRLIGCTPEEFMNRPDVQFTMEFAQDQGYAPGPEAATSPDEDIESAVLPLLDRLEAEAMDKSRVARAYCVANGLVAHEELENAARFLLSLQVMEIALKDDDPHRPSARLAHAAAEMLLQRCAPEVLDMDVDNVEIPQRLRPALEQLGRAFADQRPIEPRLLDPAESRQSSDPAL